MKRYLLILDGEAVLPGINKKIEKDIAKNSFSIMLSEFEDFEDNKDYIYTLCKSKCDFVILLDSRDLICFVYKAESLYHVRHVLLPSIEEAYQFLAKEQLVLEKIEDLRYFVKKNIFKHLLN